MSATQLHDASFLTILSYWTPMKKIFANGEISEKTRARVEAARTQRIADGRFRRKISNEV